MKLTDFDYKLPKELIAQYPVVDREKARLMVLQKDTSQIHDKAFEDIVEYFNKGDCLVLNDTKVIPARLFGKRKTGGKVEIFLLEKKDPISEALLRPSGKLKEGETLTLESGDSVEVLGRGEVGRLVKFNNRIDDILKKCGHTPLPPYIKRADESQDKDSYQTIYAKNEGATASPTAGLHFTKEVLKRIEDKGVRICYITLHTSYGTFAPIKVDDVKEHNMHSEYFNISKESIEIIQKTKKEGKKIFAVGTTATRVLEHYFTTHQTTGYTNLFIYPGYEFKAVDSLITNFHLPKSTLLLLVSAFAGKELIFKAYEHAIENGYRFYSYGDATLII